MTASVVVGIFVGGKSSRMGGRPKGLLPTAEGETLVTRLARTAREAIPAAEVVLVGASEPYASLGVRMIADDPAGMGPLGGLSALLGEARRLGAPAAIALACDMPYVTSALLARLATTAPDAVAVAPRIDGTWQPFFARYDAQLGARAIETSLAGGRRSLRSVLDNLGEGAREMGLTPEEAMALGDWDEPGDVR